MELTVTTAKYALVLMSVGGAAAGLNLGVMELTDPGTTDATQEVLLSSGSEPVAQDPLQVVVDVPVVVPDAVVDGGLAEDPTRTISAPAQASFSAPSPAAVQTRTKTMSSTTTGQDTAVTTKAPTTTAAPAKQAVATKAAAPAETAAPQKTQPPATTAAPQTIQGPATTAAAAAVSGTEYKYYDFPGVASQIIVARHGDGSLEFWSVTTESGWRYQVEEDTSSMVEVEFSQEPDGEGEAKWILRYEGGDLKVEKEISFDEDDEDDDEHDEYDEHDEHDEYEEDEED